MLLSFLLLLPLGAAAQINISGKVFGGARQADINGHTFVEIGAEKHDVIINAVYGGNDIAGTIGSSTKPSGVDDDGHISDLNIYNVFVRTDKEADGKHLFVGQLFGGGYGDYTYTPSGDNYSTKITYKVATQVLVPNSDPEEYEWQYVDQEITLDDIKKPEIDRTYVDIHGGTFGYVYGGGNNVTVNSKTYICINNESTPWELRGDDDIVNTSDDVISDPELQAMGINTEYFDQTGAYNFSRVFGGNNKAPMAIMPTWHLQAGKIENLYSGGNEGPMTSPVGLLMEINPEVPESLTVAQAEAIKNKLVIENVYGGCRKADVHPLSSTGQELGSSEIQLPSEMLNPEGNPYQFPAGLSARVLIYGGKITNVYGGNDVSGRVYGGNAVGIYHSIKGNVFGGGNGSYPYTDNTLLASDPHYGDFFYNKGSNSVDSLNNFRPNAEQVSIFVKGKEDNPTVIGGGIFCGGNSATLKTTRSDAMVELKIGSHVIADKVFLGNNGEYMKQYENDNDVLKLYSKYVNTDRSLTSTVIEGSKFNSLDMTDPTTFAKYMDGCALNLNPRVVFDANYVDYSTYFGSFFCGGNVGSMTVSGKDGPTTISFDKKVIVYSKVVGGCNDAYINQTTYNAAYQGGIIGSDGTGGTPNERTSYVDGSGNIKDRLVLNFNGLKIMPLRSPIAEVDDNARTGISIPSHIPLVWNTIKLGERNNDGSPVPVAWNNNTWYPAGGGHDALYNSTVNRRFNDGNIYGGCCNSGVVNGNVVININATVVDRTGAYGVFDVLPTDDKTGEDKLYDNAYDFTGHQAVSGVILGQQGMDVLGSALNIFGGGKGADTEIWGSTTVNLNRGYVFQIFGGSEQGAIGKRKTNLDGSNATDENGKLVYEYNPKYSTYVNLSGSSSHPGVSKKDDMSEELAEAEFLYGGGFEGPIAGNTRINLDNGRIFNTFAGSCNADIQGHTETYVGVNGFPYVRDYIYGGNDLGGKILGQVNVSSQADCNFQSRLRCYDDDNNSTDVSGNNTAYLAKVHNTDMLNASAYIEYIQGHVDKIFGGCYGVYDYTNPLFGKYFYASNATDKTDENLGTARDGYSKPHMVNAFINFRPTLNNNTINIVNQIYGAGQGYFGEKQENLMQNSSYILIDIPQTMETYENMVVFGGGECGGVGMGVDPTILVDHEVTQDQTTTTVPGQPDKGSAIIDLLSGRIKRAYGGSYMEGVTRRTVVNVPTGSTIDVESIFGGAFGTDTYHPCDVYEANVNYRSEFAKVTNAIYGGNNNERRTIYSKVNIYTPVYNGQTNPNNPAIKYTGTVYGAGRGANSWSEYTEVNLEDGASVYEVYGGGQAGKVHNAESIQHFMNHYKPTLWPKEKDSDPDVAFTDDDWKYAWTLGEGYDPETFTFSSSSTSYLENTKTNLNNPWGLVRTAEMDDRDYTGLTDVEKGKRQFKYNTNVIIKRGATVSNYAYGGGLGEDAVVAGTTYIALLGGTVKKDIYAAGTSGSVEDLHGAGSFTASANAYIEGGSARNVYGGGWKGNVGHHAGVVMNQGQENEYTEYLEAPYYDTSTHELLDIPGETHVVIGILKDNLAASIPQGETEPANYYFYNGIPAIERNAYGGGEGGAVWGTTYVVMNNGYIGYNYNKAGTDVATTLNIDERYEEKIEDDTYIDADGHFQNNKRLDDAGCIFGGGYIDNSSVDFTNVTMYGGHVRNALFGGGEIAAIGRGKIQETTVDGKTVRSLQGIYRPGKTLIEMFDGYVHRNVFGGGRGYNNLGEGGKLFSDGYVFGQTLVHIHGGEIGTEDELIAGNGNVFGGGDIGYVYSAYEYDDGNGHKLPRKGVKDGVRYDGDGMYQGYYYEHVWENDNTSTESNFIHYTHGVEDSGGNERKLTEDCKVLIAPHCKVTDPDGITLTIKYDKGQVVSAHDLSYISTHPELSSLGIDAFGKVTANGGISFTRHYNKGQYVQTSALHTFGNREESRTDWAKLEANTNNDGIIIHNAVFAGGNTSSKGSDDVNAYANSTSVYGNATASIHDVYHRDLVTIGTGHIGGLYGDGNLTFVDGYRGLNITNYGTDYHYLYEEENMKELTKAQYDQLLDREKDYYELRYKCILECIDDDGTHYFPEDVANHKKASTLTADDILTLFANQSGMFTIDTDGHKIPNPTYWAQNGVCSIYAGRILNTIQRADFCGVFGSRLVLQGAQDRVPEVVDYTKYTINRVREVSLNKKHSVIDADQSNPKRVNHGNYFGIYNIVNYLGALTSDFDFGDQGTSGDGSTDTQDAAGRVDNGDGTFSYYTSDVGSSADVRTSDNINTGTYGPQYPGQTFYGWKRFHYDDQTRNNGNSHNKVALASGVYLELTTEESIGKELNEKVWGLITGVVELDLINVQQGMGGGFVYAKNVHGVRTKMDRTNTTLTALNAGAATRWDYKYEEPSLTSDAEDLKQRNWQTSGNFVHSTQTIIDDCYNVSNKYKGPDQVPAHYWYIKGSVYVYDQYISAYTGATNAYSEVVDIPLTITAASHGNMKLLNVQPNLYAYRNTDGQKLSGEQKLIINDIEYTLNTPITYWDWYKLTTAEKNLFVPETYVSIAKYKYNQEATDVFPAEQVMLPTDYETIKTHAHHMTDDQGQEVRDENNKPILQLWDVENEKYVLADEIIRSSNNLGHGTGYILTYKVNNPTDWDTWYTEYLDSNNNASKPREKDQDKGELADDVVGGVHKGPNDGPTYRLKSNTGELLGQRDYKVSDLIAEDVKTTYEAIGSGHIPSSGQAVFSRAYVATGETDITRMGQSVHLYKGSTMSATEASGASNVTEALICTKTIRLSSTDNLYINSVMTQAEKTTHLTNVNTAISTLLAEINAVLGDNNITPIDAGITDINSLTVAQQNKITALQKKELSDLLMRKKDITNNIVPAYYCTTAGLYGGNYYESGRNYRGLEAWSSMDEKDRAKFTFNYDAFDLLIDPDYGGTEGEKYQYDSEAGTKAGAEANPAGYSLEKPVDYTATYNGADIDLGAKGLSDINVKRGNDVDFTTSTSIIKSGDELSRTVFESLPNEQRHYTPLTVTSTDVAGGKTRTFYVVKTPLMVGPTPYTTGNILTEDDFNTLYPTEAEQQQHPEVEVLNYTTPGTWYFCRDEYTPPTGSDQTVTGHVGSVITSGVYDLLTNLQKNFTIHGIAPTETSTLYVSRFSDINDLSTEKIITVIYEYNYEESDVLGTHITPVTERHVLNIHINFKTGAPIVEDIEAPQIILPGTILSLIPPNVIEGASPIQGGGWELYPTESDADNHNGVEYIPDIDPLYWYQHGYWLRYYALSYVGGKTYSNKVQVSVANYHDLKQVMEDKEHHYYIDIPNLNRLREPKIYINDATDGLNQLKNLFDLSLLTTTPTGTLAGHALLDQQVNSCQNLEFFMHTNINQTGTWTPIANNDGECFSGTLHGDGYYISGLDHSLFNHLCGSVYNLGVMGTFAHNNDATDADAGIAETAGDNGVVETRRNDGYVENCWVINNNNAEAKKSKPVFSSPANDSKYHIVNCYYMEEEDTPVGYQYTNHSGTYPGTPICMPMEAFYNGTVAYDLNGFYLYKRFNDMATTSGTAYKYYIPGVVDAETKRLIPQTGKFYAQNPKYCSSGTLTKNNQNADVSVYLAGGYVEDRYADGDFRYANGEIPTYVDERLYTDKQDQNKTKFYPIWPDDYLFFGQMLTFDWNESRPHESVPSHLVKDGGRLMDSDESNRVYCAPAYYRNAIMDVAHFNPAANLVNQSKPKNAADTSMKNAYPNMTAIDFAGHNDYSTTGFKVGWASHTTSSPYWAADDNGKFFYPPLLDDDGLLSIVNRDETPNLLVYAPSAEANLKTNTVLNGYFTEPAYSDYYQGGNYRCVTPAPTQTIFGHMVQSNLATTSDHLLVDKKDFFCPITYDLGDGKHIWYQRVAKTYVDLTKGWESISLPFMAELVTTNQKGEITHFYSGSNTINNETMIGNEYWLREYKDLTTLKASERFTSASAAEQNKMIAEAIFNYPDASGSSKTVNNTFLWDYYYNNSNALIDNNHHLDKNLDTYQTYYNSSRTYENYPLLANGTPYLIGFPGAMYYEFDLSGNFEALTTADNNPEKIGEQTISFVSNGSYRVLQSDTELHDATYNGYTFHPSYLNEALAAGTDAYTMKDDGSQYDKVPATGDAKTPVVAFRPYFVKAPAGSRESVDYIVFNSVASRFGDAESDPSKGEVPDGMLNIYAKTGKVVVESSLRNEADVSIFTTSGLLVSSFTIKPGETIETPINLTGIYIIRAANGHFTKKLKVKR